MISLLNNLSPSQQNITPNVGLSTTSATNSNSQAKADSSNEVAVRLSLSPEAQKFLKNSQENNQTKETLQGSSDQNKKSPEDLTKQKNNLSQANPRLNNAQQQVVQKLESRDQHVRGHEAAHMAVAGSYAVGGPSYQFEVGPDGKSYAVGGEVQLDMSSVPNDPQATIAKAETIRAGALAPSDPSGADLGVAAAATEMAAQARMELAQKNQKEVSANSSSNPESNSNISNTSNSNLANKNRDSKLQAYKNFTMPNYTGLKFNQSF